MNAPDAVGSRLTEDPACVLAFIQSHVEEDLSLGALAVVIDVGILIAAGGSAAHASWREAIS